MYTGCPLYVFFLLSLAPGKVRVAMVSTGEKRILKIRARSTRYLLMGCKLKASDKEPLLNSY